jgi:hypothetical protein
MDRAAVADALDESHPAGTAGRNPFKTRAYGNAARILRGLDRDLADLVRRKALGEMKDSAPRSSTRSRRSSRRKPSYWTSCAPVPAGMLER